MLKDDKGKKRIEKKETSFMNIDTNFLNINEQYESNSAFKNTPLVKLVIPWMHDY